MLLTPFSVPSFIWTCVISKMATTPGLSRDSAFQPPKESAADQGRPLLSESETCLADIHITPGGRPELILRTLRSAPAWGHGCKEGCFLRPHSLPPHTAFACFSRRQICSPRSRWRSLHGSCFLLDYLCWWSQSISDTGIQRTVLLLPSLIIFLLPFQSSYHVVRRSAFVFPLWSLFSLLIVGIWWSENQ